MGPQFFQPDKYIETLTAADWSYYFPNPNLPVYLKNISELKKGYRNNYYPLVVKMKNKCFSLSSLYRILCQGLIIEHFFPFWFQQQKKVELKETLLNELQEKKKVIESERISMELTGG